MLLYYKRLLNASGGVKKSVLQIVLGVTLIVFAISIIIVVLLQEGHQQNVAAANIKSESFYSTHKSRSIDAFLERWTKFISIGFFILVIATNAVVYFL